MERAGWQGFRGFDKGQFAGKDGLSGELAVRSGHVPGAGGHIAGLGLAEAGVSMNEDLADLEAALRKLKARCACVVLQDGRMLDIDCCGRCQDAEI